MSESAAAHRQLARGLCVLVVIAAFAVFWQALSADFVNWDDDEGLLTNQHYRGLGIDHLTWMFSTFHMGHYQPLTWLSHAVDHALWQMDPRGYHLQNLIWHALGTGVLFALLRRLIAFARRGRGTPTIEDTWIACFAALWFAVHPLRVESVAWITERRDLLSSCLLFATVLAWLRYTAARSSGVPVRGAMAMVLVCYTASLLAKAWGMTLPAVLLLLDVWPLRRWRARAWRGLVVEKLPLFALGTTAAILAAAAQTSSGAAVDVVAHGVGQRIAQAAYGLCFYVAKTALPFDLIALYPIPGDLGLTSPKYLGSVAAVVVISGATIAIGRRFPAIAITWWCYLVLLSPVLGLLQSGPQLVADRYSYLSCIGWAALLAAWLRPSPRRVPVLLACLVLTGALGALTWQQTMVWRDSLALWKHALAIDPDGRRAHVKFGLALVDPRRQFGVTDVERAIDHYRRALEIAPDNVRTHRYLGDAYARLGRFDAAVQSWLTYSAAFPADPLVVEDLGRAYRVLGDHEQAVRYLRAYVEGGGEGDADAWCSLGESQAALGRHDAAVQSWRNALRVQPGHVRAERLLGTRPPEGR